MRHGHINIYGRHLADFGGGVAQIDCLECGGSGIWDFYPEGWIHTPGDTVCIDCKGRGRVYTMYYSPWNEVREAWIELRDALIEDLYLVQIAEALNNFILKIYKPKES